jgi:hypothetical protein
VVRRQIISVNFEVGEKCGRRGGGREGETIVKKFPSFYIDPSDLNSVLYNN